MNTNDMKSVVIPHVFFKKERGQIYSDWGMAFWREMFQNSNDAGASVIKITLESIPVEEGESLVKVVFDDDGCGMTTEILNDVFFQLGKSSKDGPTTIGGFGRARILTCFAMQDYTIHTANNEVWGVGSQYRVTELSPEYPGCKFSVTVDDMPLHKMRSKLMEYLRQSNPPCEVYINDEKWVETTDIGDLVREVTLPGETKPFAKMYVKKNPDHNLYRTIVRVKGSCMFDCYCRANAQVILEISPEVSRDVLTANRDGFSVKYKETVDKLIAEINVNTETSLSPRLQTKRLVMKGSGMIHMTSNKRAVAVSRVKSVNVTPSYHSVFTILTGSYSEKVEPVEDPFDDPTEEEKREVFNEQDDARNIGIPFLPTIPIQIETYDTRIRDIAERRYDPFEWKCVLKDGVIKCNSHKDEFKVWAAWKICCHHAMGALIGIERKDSVTWAAGFTFGYNSSELEGDGKDGKFMMINPLNDDGTMKFNIRDKMSVKRMMAMARHLAAKVVSDWYNESFVGTLIELDGVMDDWKIWSQVCEIKC